MTRYLQLEDVLRQIERAGFIVRDPGLLAGALARPQTSAFGQDAYSTLWEKAAALCQSIDHNQSLVDGNKRLAWLVTKVFWASTASSCSIVRFPGQASRRLGLSGATT